MLYAQLSAGRINIRTMLLANRTADTLLHQCVIKNHRMGVIHSLKSIFIHCIVGNEVHIGIQTL